MKQIDISKMSDTEKKETVKEAKILEVLSHPNIVKFIEVFKTKNGKLCIVMDFADGKFTFGYGIYWASQLSLLIKCD